MQEDPVPTATLEDAIAIAVEGLQAMRPRRAG
jgi:hypothetical protein